MSMLQSAAKTIIGVDILFLLLLGFSFLYVEPGTKSYVVGQITLFPIAATFLASVVVLYFDWAPFE